MNDVCQQLHDIFSSRQRFKSEFESKELPANGLYFLFEKGEVGHDCERIVRVGTHTGQNNLAKRIQEHLFANNKDRSIFRKHIGRSLLLRKNDPFIAQWEIDLTTRKSREENANKIDEAKLATIEGDVTNYMKNNFSFCVLEIDDKSERLHTEQRLLSTIAQCPQCRPSKNWLGRNHPNPTIRESGLWNIQGLDGQSLTVEEVTAITENS